MKTADTRKETRDAKSQIETTVQKQHVIVAAALPLDLQQGENISLLQKQKEREHVAHCHCRE